MTEIYRGHLPSTGEPGVERGKLILVASPHLPTPHIRLGGDAWGGDRGPAKTLYYLLLLARRSPASSPLSLRHVEAARQPARQLQTTQQNPCLAFGKGFFQLFSGAAE